MQIKDVIHLYLGCEVQTPQRKYRPEGGKSYKNIGRLMDIDLVIMQGGVHFSENAITDLVHFPFDQLKPILRRLSSMTEEEKQEEINVTEKQNAELFDGRLAAASGIHFLLSLHFDLFGLIDAGLAIDKDKM